MTKEYAYLSKQDGNEIIVTQFAKFVTIGRGPGMTCCKSMDEAEQKLTAMGYIRKGFKDEQGITRHEMPRFKIEAVYNQLQNFIADCTVEEFRANEQAFTAIKTLLHQRMQ